jgi:hypothetical protein
MCPILAPRRTGLREVDNCAQVCLADAGRVRCGSLVAPSSALGCAHNGAYAGARNALEDAARVFLGIVSRFCWGGRGRFNQWLGSDWIGTTQHPCQAGQKKGVVGRARPGFLIQRAMSCGETGSRVRGFWVVGWANWNGERRERYRRLDLCLETRGRDFCRQPNC